MQYQRLRGAVAPGFSLARAPTWDDALETIRVRPVEIAVVDPMLGGARGQEVERLRVLFPSLPLIPVHADDDTRARSRAGSRWGSAASVRSC